MNFKTFEVNVEHSLLLHKVSRKHKSKGFWSNFRLQMRL